MGASATRKLLGTAAGLIIVAGAGTLLVRGLSSTTPVSTESALEQFRAEAGPQTSDSQPADTSSAAQTAEPPVAGPALPAPRPPQSAASAPAEQNLTPPEPGVYLWHTNGFEEVPGVRREMPDETNSILTHQGPDRWREHYRYSQEREQWLDLIISPAGVASPSVRNRVVIGPIVADRTVVFDPPAIFARFPSRVGDAWQGSFSGKTNGSYTGRTFENTTLRIGDEDLEVWASEVVMHMQGEVEGDVTVQVWINPLYRLAVKQHQIATIRNGPGTYHSEWTSLLKSVRPQR